MSHENIKEPEGSVYAYFAFPVPKGKDSILVKSGTSRRMTRMWIAFVYYVMRNANQSELIILKVL